MGNAVIFNGNHVKTLKPGLQLKGEATIWSGNIDPSVTGFVAAQGDIYISTLTEKTYTKIGPGNTDWRDDSSTTTPGDIAETDFTALDNQPTPQSVVGLAFSNASVRAFKGILSISRNTTFSEVEFLAVQKSASWSLSTSEVGDETGISFDITNAGQVTYTSTSTGDDADLTFRAWVLGV